MPPVLTSHPALTTVTFSALTDMETLLTSSSRPYPYVIVGNVLRTGIYEVWNSSELEQLAIPAQQHFDASACGAYRIRPEPS
jgi:hypothetical protein